MLRRPAFFLLTALLFCVLLFSGNASADWVKRFWTTQSLSLSTNPTGMGVDAGGNVYVAGTFTSESWGPTFVLMKYDASGHRQWLKRKRGVTMETSPMPHMAVDSNGNVYLLGPSGTDAEHKTATMTLTKYDADGNRGWSKHLPGLPIDFPYCELAADDEGVYVSRSSVTLNDQTEEFELVTVKYDPSGVRQWVARYKDSRNAILDPRNVVVDGNGNVYIGGPSWTSPDYTCRFVTLKYDREGSLQWKRSYPNAWPSGNNSLAVNASGSVYLCCFGLSTTSGPYDLVIVKYDALGTLQWVRRYNRAGTSAPMPQDIVTDSAGNVYVTRVALEGDSSDCTFTVKYDPNGVRQWIHTFPGFRYPTFYNTLLHEKSIAVDGKGNVYLTTRSDPGGLNDIATVKINSDGGQEWVKSYAGGPGGLFCDVGGIVLNGNEDIYVNGIFAETGRDGIVTIKYEQ